jgi:hypothetical protein
MCTRGSASWTNCILTPAPHTSMGRGPGERALAVWLLARDDCPPTPSERVPSTCVIVDNSEIRSRTFLYIRMRLCASCPQPVPRQSSRRAARAGRQSRRFAACGCGPAVRAAPTSPARRLPTPALIKAGTRCAARSRRPALHVLLPARPKLARQ